MAQIRLRNGSAKPSTTDGQAGNGELGARSHVSLWRRYNQTARPTPGSLHDPSIGLTMTLGTAKNWKKARSASSCARRSPTLQTHPSLPVRLGILSITSTRCNSPALTAPLALTTLHPTTLQPYNPTTLPPSTLNLMSGLVPLLNQHRAPTIDLYLLCMAGSTSSG